MIIYHEIGSFKHMTFKNDSKSELLSETKGSVLIVKWSWEKNQCLYD